MILLLHIDQIYRTVPPDASGVSERCFCQYLTWGLLWSCPVTVTNGKSWWSVLRQHGASWGATAVGWRAAAADTSSRELNWELAWWFLDAELGLWRVVCSRNGPSVAQPEQGSTIDTHTQTQTQNSNTPELCQLLVMVRHYSIISPRPHLQSNLYKDVRVTEIVEISDRLVKTVFFYICNFSVYFFKCFFVCI